jgi:phosphatidylglycerol---prolipoprotein diacylglyceryl transferase
MFPTVLNVPALQLIVRSNPLMLLLAAVVGLTLGPRWAQALEGVDAGKALRALLVLAVAAFLGARLHFVLNNWAPLFANRPLSALNFWSGMHAGGGIVAMVLASVFVIPRLGVPIGKLLDGLIPTIGVCIALGRVGCFLEGCCFGSACAWPWCITFPRESYIHTLHVQQGLIAASASRTASIHPLQLYFAAAALGIAATALWLRRRKRYDGQVALVGLLLFSSSAAALEFFRADQPLRVYWGLLPQLEWTALAMTTASIIALAVAEYAHSRRSLAAIPAS